MTDAKVKVTISADDKAAQQALKDLESNLNQLKQASTAVGGAMTAMGASIMAGATVAVKSYMNMGDEIHKLSQKINFSTESLSEWGHVLRIGGADLNNLQTAIRTMSSAIIDANDGLETYQRAFEHLNIDYRELAGLSVEQQFEKISYALADCRNETEQLALAQDVFGRSGLNMLPVIKQGTEAIAELREEAHELGIVWSEDAAQGAADLTDSFQKLTSAIDGVKIQFAEALQPILLNYTEMLTSAGKAISGFAQEHQAATSIIANSIVSLGAVSTILGGMILILPRLIPYVRSLGFAFKTLSIQAAAITAGLTAVMWAWQELSKRQRTYDTYVEAHTKLYEEQQKAIAGEANAWEDAADAYADAFAEYLKISTHKGEERKKMYEHINAIKQEAAEIRAWKEAVAEATEEAEAQRDAIQALINEGTDLVKQWSFERSEAGQLGITMQDIYYHLLDIGVATEDVIKLYANFGASVENMNELLESTHINLKDIAEESENTVQGVNSVAEAMMSLNEQLRINYEWQLKAKKAAGEGVSGYSPFAAMAEFGLSFEQAQQLGKGLGADLATLLMGGIYYGGESLEKTLEVIRKHGVDVESYQLGGEVQQTGLAFVHKGETVIPQGGLSFNIYIGERFLGRYLLDEVTRELKIQGVMS